MEQMEVDTEKRPFLCGRCSSSVARPLSEVEVVVDEEASVAECIMCGSRVARDPNIPGGPSAVVTPDSKAYQCARCGDPFTTQAALVEHMTEKHSKEGDFMCEVCNKTFFSHGNLYRHRKLHSTSKPFPCDVCHKSYSSEPYLKAHMWEHVSERPFACDVCDKRFPLLVHLKRHAAVHATGKAYVCDICERHFPSMGNLRRHKQTHVLYECQVCSRRYPKMGQLKEHMQEHMEDRPFECDVCERHFASEILLRAHAWVHTREKLPFFCKKCKQRFALSREFKEHNVTVHNEGPPQRTKKMYSVDGEADDEGEEGGGEASPTSFERPDSPNEPLEIKYVYEPNKRFQCDVCDKMYKTLRIRNQHQRLHTGERPYECNVCNATFTTRTNMRRHRDGHDKQNPHVCSVCGKTYKTTGALKTHLWEHNEQKPYPCSQCGKSFSMKTHLKRHMIIHDENRKYKCELCPMAFTQSQNMKRHQATHSATLKHPCPVCKSMFKTVTEMRLHMQDHNSARRYMCTLCHRKYTTEANLKSHMWTHAEKRFHCKVCDKRYASSFFLRRHMTGHAQHERESAYQCEICMKKFLKAGNFKSHMAAHNKTSWPRCPVCDGSFHDIMVLDWHVKRNHPTSRMFPCAHCDEHFHLNRQRDRHVDVEHAEMSRPFVCATCQESFKTEDGLTAHQAAHGVLEPFRCQTCEMRFPSKVGLVVHMRIHSATFRCKYCKLVLPNQAEKIAHMQTMDDDVHKPYVCDICNKRFGSKQRLERHVMVHTGEKPYRCTSCGKKFRQAAHLKEHERSHSNDKPYVCNMCDRSFSYLKSVRSHVEQCMNGKQIGGDTCPCGCYGNTDKHDENSARSVTNESDEGTSRAENRSDSKKPAETDLSIVKLKTVIQTRSKSRQASDNSKEKADEVSKVVKEEQVEEGDKSKEAKDDGKSSSQTEAAKTSTGEGVVFIVEMGTDAKPTEEDFRCPTCQKTLSTRDELCRHNRVHLNEEPYRCGICKATFSDSAPMVVHVKDHLKVAVNLRCDLCDTTFPHLKFYCDHVAKHRQSEHPCPHCHLKFIRKGKLALHVRTKHSKLFYEGNASSVKMLMDADAANITHLVKTEATVKMVMDADAENIAHRVKDEPTVKMVMEAGDIACRVKTEPTTPEEHEAGAAVLAALARGGNKGQIETTEVVRQDGSAGKLEGVKYLEKRWKVVSLDDESNVVRPTMVSTGTSMSIVYDQEGGDEPPMDTAVTTTAAEEVQYEVATLEDDMPENYEIVALVDDSNANQLSELTSAEQILYTTDGQMVSTGNAALDDAVRIIANQTDTDGGTIIIKIEYDDSQ